MKRSDQINEIAAALARAQGQMTHVGFNATNPAFKSRYATLAAVVEAVRAQLSEAGVCFLQTVNPVEEGIYVSTILAHQSGQWIELDGPIVPVDKKNAHGAMSATTYAKRGALAAALCLAADEDDDGNAAAVAPAKTVPVRELMQLEDALRLDIERAKTLAELKQVGAKIATATDKLDVSNLKKAYFYKQKQLKAEAADLVSEEDAS